MLDFGHLPKPLTGTVDYFPGFSTTDGGAWEVWNKPRGCTFIRILTIGGGGGGGRGGAANGAATSAGGGGGGASSGMTTLTIPAIFVPDRLYVSSGTGGAGGSSGAGSAGIPSIVAIAPANVNIYILCYAKEGTGGGLGSNTTITGGAGGTGGSTAAISTANQGFQGHFNAIVGQNGANGGSSITYPTTGLLLSGGSGGGTINASVTTTAGNINAPASQTSVYTLFQTLTATLFTDGKAGVELYQPLMSCGGVGGGSVITGGRRGGDGGFGSGGGGGGASTANGASGGRGGNGGPGLVVIQTW
jgi:hypothetical protein